MSEYLKITRNGQILEIVLDRPKANTLDAPLSREMGRLGTFMLPKLLPRQKALEILMTGRRFGAGACLARPHQRGDRRRIS